MMWRQLSKSKCAGNRKTPRSLSDEKATLILDLNINKSFLLTEKGFVERQFRNDKVKCYVGLQKLLYFVVSDYEFCHGDGLVQRLLEL